jgi:hypothetical protein
VYINYRQYTCTVCTVQRGPGSSGWTEVCTEVPEHRLCGVQTMISYQAGPCSEGTEVPELGVQTAHTVHTAHIVHTAHTVLVYMYST